jgi:adenylate cyclase
VIGDAVNTASRLEGLTKEAGRAVLISQTTRDLLDSAAATPLEPLGAFAMRGKDDKLEVFGLKPAGLG